jgi:hypothetical protein
MQKINHACHLQRNHDNVFSEELIIESDWCPHFNESCMQGRWGLDGPTAHYLDLNINNTAGTEVLLFKFALNGRFRIWSKLRCTLDIVHWALYTAQTMFLEITPFDFQSGTHGVHCVT